MSVTFLIEKVRSEKWNEKCKDPYPLPPNQVNTKTKYPLPETPLVLAGFLFWGTHILEIYVGM